MRGLAQQVLHTLQRSILLPGRGLLPLLDSHTRGFYTRRVKPSHSGDVYRLSRFPLPYAPGRLFFAPILRAQPFGLSLSRLAKARRQSLRLMLPLLHTFFGPLATVFTLSLSSRPSLEHQSRLDSPCVHLVQASSLRFAHTFRPFCLACLLPIPSLPRGSIRPAFVRFPTTRASFLRFLC
jgi:hypothetical protein